MAYAVVFIMVLAVTFATNDQQDLKYETLQSELSALKNHVLKMNVQLENVQKKYDDMSEELWSLRSKQGIADTKTPRKADQIDNYQLKIHGTQTLLNKRSTVYSPTFQLPSVWNVSKVSKGQKGEPGLGGPKGDSGRMGFPGLKGNNGPKGDRGKVGITGPKGDMGSPGLEGQKGSTGATGSKGDTGRPGRNGQKGDTGPAGARGITGPIGPKGDVGIPGANGHRGSTGHHGTSPSQGTKISFAAESKVTMGAKRHSSRLAFHSPYWNDGNNFDRSNGKFSCREPGVYLFTMSIAPTVTEKTVFMLFRNDQVWHSITSTNNTGSVTGIARLAQRDTVSVRVQGNHHNIAPICYFEGVLLYQ